MRMPQFRIRTLMTSITFLALILTVIGQAILLQRSVAREQRLRAEAEQLRAKEERARALAEEQVRRSEATSAQISALIERARPNREP